MLRHKWGFYVDDSCLQGNNYEFYLGNIVNTVKVTTRIRFRYSSRKYGLNPNQNSFVSGLLGFIYGHDIDIDEGKDKGSTERIHTYK